MARQLENTPKMPVNLALVLALLLGTAPTAVQADVLLLKKGKGVKILGLDKKIGDQEVDENNWRIFLPKSTGVVVEQNYDSIVWKKSAKTKKIETYALAQVSVVALTSMNRSDGWRLRAGGERIWKCRQGPWRSGCAASNRRSGKRRRRRRSMRGRVVNYPMSP